MTNLNSVVIDLETLDTAESAAILSIGAVEFDINDTDIGSAETKNHQTKLWHIELLPQLLQQGRTVSASTLEWWQKQSDTAKEAAIDTHTFGLKQILDFLADYSKDKTVYFRGTDFDGAILEHAYKQLGIKCPWKYNAKRDVRSHIDAIMGTTTGYLDIPKPDWITPHRADHDALWDAYQLQQAEAHKRQIMCAASEGKYEHHTTQKSTVEVLPEQLG